MERFKFSHLVAFTAVLCTLLIPEMLHAQQSSSTVHGFSIEVGGGYYQLLREATEPVGETPSADRTAFSLMPTARLGYHHPFSKNINLYSFLGYNELGGKSTLKNRSKFTAPNVRYNDEYTIRSIEAGVISTYPLAGLRIGIGAKVNYHFDTQQRYYFENHPNRLNGWHTSEGRKFFTDWPLDAGARLEYPVYRHVMLGAESWFGLTDIGEDRYPIHVRAKPLQGTAGIPVPTYGVAETLTWMYRV